MARIDDSHAPFKRTTKIGPGPSKRPPIKQSGSWECQKGQNTKTHYVQVCTYVGTDRKRRGKKIKVKTEIDAKLAYGKKYRKWAKKQKRIQAMLARGPRTGYRCRKTRIAKCNGKKKK